MYTQTLARNGGEVRICTLERARRATATSSNGCLCLAVPPPVSKAALSGASGRASCTRDRGEGEGLLKTQSIVYLCMIYHYLLNHEINSTYNKIAARRAGPLVRCPASWGPLRTRRGRIHGTWHHARCHTVRLPCTWNPRDLEACVISSGEGTNYFHLWQVLPSKPKGLRGRDAQKFQTSALKLLFLVSRCPCFGSKLVIL